MPVTLSVADHASKIWTGHKASTAGDLPQESCQQESEQSKGILRSSFSHDLLSTNHISPSKHGLVYAAFLMSFEEPAAPAVKDFWGKTAHHQSGNSGPTYLSGWITAFCFWDEKGQSLVRLPDRNGCEVDGALYHRVDTKQIPSDYFSVPVTLNDKGKVHHTKMTTGSVGIQTSYSPSRFSTGMPSSKQSGISTVDASRTAIAGSAQRDTLQPVSGWWTFEVDPNAPDPETQHKLREQKQLEHIRKQLEDSRKRCDQGVK
ncbi:hypothetical protein CB0940_08151 [Cercospora beticola]|uniref:Uncharacterized protein n=1 Tax=Cercospora beticola TaxID=122368 RepID=A0A2G5HR89_CERBT|nr:hypothetical protein CB0940_08151 [Cercospora beticola]PIA95055.1 hypothetical protein CB0940_08151 [Cercospora beticola]WPB04716.1 hypothetical protein RHO25_009363 [Cercospora beticola]CAK1364468.1 unnamed protein product [Cercospora beticola]